MEDSKIIALLFARSEQSLTALARRFGAQLQRMAANILGDRRDAEEAVNDTYLALWNAIPPQKPQPLEPYVYRTGKNQALKRLRENRAEKRRGNYELSLEELEGCIPGSSLEDTVSARELGRAIDRYLSILPAENRRIFLRRYWYGDSIRQIAADYALTANAVSLRLLRTREGLQAFLQKEELL